MIKPKASMVSATRRPFGRSRPALVAIVGGSGSGKSWLASQLRERLGKEAVSLSLDDFYRDRSHLPLAARARLNFDHPRAIDWAAFERALMGCQAGRCVRVPRYDFRLHAPRGLEWWTPKRIVLVEGLWLLGRPSVRRLFQLRIFVSCTKALRLERRLQRDTGERGRSAASVRAQFHGQVHPMHERHVAPQVRWADRIVQSPVSHAELDRLAGEIRNLLAPQQPRARRRVRQ